MTFFQTGRKYAVIGASSSPFKYGYKVLNWYVKHELPVFGVNPKGGEILGVKVFKNVSEYLDNNKGVQLSLSVITPPEQSLEVFKQIVNNGYVNNIKSVWFQPGSYNKEVIKYVREKYELPDEEIIRDGECILVNGIYKLRESESLNDAK